MHPRKKLEIGWSDLAHGAFACLRRSSRDEAECRVESLFGSRASTLACLSVRSAFHLYLDALQLPRGSEVLMSAVTIRDMVRIVERHGLVPVPVDLDMDSLTVSRAHLERARSGRSRMLVVAHLFGSRMEMVPIAEFAREWNLILVEDCAQAFMADGYRGHEETDATLFSFGPIKTRTALGGALALIRDDELLARMRHVHESWPVRSDRWFFARILKYAVVAALLSRTGLGVLNRAARLLGTSHDEVISRSVRGFPGPDFFETIAQRPPRSLLDLLRRRLETGHPGCLDERVRTARRAAEWMPFVPRPGCRSSRHGHWVFPACPPDPDRLMRRLWQSGFDATRGASSLGVVDPPPSRPECEPAEARSVMERVLYLPVDPSLPEGALRELCRLVQEEGALEEALHV